MAYDLVVYSEKRLVSGQNSINQVVHVIIVAIYECRLIKCLLGTSFLLYFAEYSLVVRTNTSLHMVTYISKPRHLFCIYVFPEHFSVWHFNTLEEFVFLK